MLQTSLREEKARLRAEALGRRDGLDPEFRARASRSVCDRLLALPELDGSGTVSGFWPIRSEVDIRPAMLALDARGWTLALPVVTRAGLIFRRWAPGEAVAVTAFGLTVPLPQAPALAPRILIVPLAAFDRAGGRLGYGKGHYDGAIAALSVQGPIATVGVAFAAQEVEAVPRESHDRRLDLIVTETAVVRPG